MSLQPKPKSAVNRGITLPTFWLRIKGYIKCCKSLAYLPDSLVLPVIRRTIFFFQPSGKSKFWKQIYFKMKHSWLIIRCGSNIISNVGPSIVLNYFLKQIPERTWENMQEYKHKFSLDIFSSKRGISNCYLWHSLIFIFKKSLPFLVLVQMSLKVPERRKEAKG